MNFTGQYLTYNEYTSLGGSLDEASFDLLEFEARRKIDGRTQNRLVGGEDLPQAVKICVYHLINSISMYMDSTSNIGATGNIASENIDGYSISYVTASQLQDVVNSKRNELNNIIRDDLMGVLYNGEHLLFRGV